MRIPFSTYRVQFNLNFRFADAEALVPYLHDLGISHLYASPRFKARKGSSHGYDVADPLRINSELGTEDEFDRLVARLHHYGMGLLLDIVPNHMAASSENPWWMDVLENGRDSRYAQFFDIDWEPEGTKLAALDKNRVVVPILAAPYDQILLQGGIRLRLDDRGFFFQYEEHRFPLNPKSYAEVLERCINVLQKANGPSENSIRSVHELQRLYENLPMQRDGEEFFERRQRVIAEMKSGFWRLHQSDAGFRQSIESALREMNGIVGDTSSFGILDRLLNAQSYRLAHWRLASTEINYRRFFDINDLIGLRVEDPLVFAARHGTIMNLVQEEKVSGLRVDHVDGLLDPLEYLLRLKSIPVNGNTNHEGLSIYTIVEKITSGHESLPAEWPCCGTTGYDFLNALNALFINADGYRAIEESYCRFASATESFSDVCYARKKQVIQELFATDLELLTRRLGRIAAAHAEGRDVPVPELIAGIKEITACLPVYRTYCRDVHPSPADVKSLQTALFEARHRCLHLSDSTFEFLRRVFLAELPLESEDRRDLWLSFILRWQQFTGAVMAKGVEDTALFAHHSLISLNEVGNSPFHEQIRFGPEPFHEFNLRTISGRPHTLNATATHDTKWSEDVRARINVLSEIPRHWTKCLRRWSRLNRDKKTRINGQFVPTPNEEAIFYQAMLGIWPAARLDEHERKCLRSRLTTFFIKAAKEAKTETSWLQPDESHEAALRRFVGRLFAAPESDFFISDFLRLHQQVSLFGACNSFAQIILKMTAPGVPDFYQGSESWNLALTDPDNRRPVDFRGLQGALEHVNSQSANFSPVWLSDLLRNWPDGRLKLYVTARLLNFRRSHPDLFSCGEYLSIEPHGNHAQSIFAFSRCFRDTWLVIAVPRLPTRVARRGNFPLGAYWGNTTISLPDAAPDSWTELFTNLTFDSPGSGESTALSVSSLFDTFPFAVLTHTPLGDPENVIADHARLPEPGV